MNKDSLNIGRTGNTRGARYRNVFAIIGIFLLSAAFVSCDEDDGDFGSKNGGPLGTNPILLVIDEDAIDNGNEPNDFSATDVNDQLAEVGERRQLKYFAENKGRTLELYTGEAGDEGLYALKTIPNSWKSAGPTNNGAINYVNAGPGLGSGMNGTDDDREVLLDKIPDVTPLRATGLKMLVGKTILAVVYDGDVSINYSPLNGNLQGANLGLVAFRVTGVTQRFDGSDSSLPKLSLVILDTEDINLADLHLFSNAPVPESSSEPFDIAPPGTVAESVVMPAN